MYGARLLLLTGTLALALAPVEWLARRHYAERDRRLSDTAVVPNGGELQLLDLLRPSPHRDLVYELRPSLTGRFLGTDYRSNALGMRGDEVSAERAPDGFRVALMGDSISFGWGVEVREGYAALLAPALSELLGGRDVEVLNFGVPGYNTATEAACLEHKALPLRPDLVVVQYFCNDAFLPNFVLAPPRHSPLRLLDWVSERLHARTSGAALEQADTDARGGRASGEVSVARWPAESGRVHPEFAYMLGPHGIERALGRMKIAADAAGIPLVLFMVSYPPRNALAESAVERLVRDLDAEVRRTCATLDITCIGTLETLSARQRARGESLLPLILSPADQHPNRVGHRVLADILLDGLRAQCAELVSSRPLR